eukprot:TRINITY_DN1597_c0_g2_i1.p2 TRINITY_DN1597_c0_g2~~TRINITY_DN1597_c0_g2_i1.p2  ORF type:complete len:501 (+),score=75.32 TRINITY_DN1597_c0_g2_i1:49-1503(+)
MSEQQVAQPDNEDLVQQFIHITGCSGEQAKFYLEAAGGNIDAAFSVYQEQQIEHTATNSQSRNYVSAAPSVRQQQQPASSNGNVQQGQQQHARGSSDIISQALKLPTRLLTVIFSFVGRALNLSIQSVFSLGRRFLPAPVIRRIRRNVEQISLQLGNRSQQEQARVFIQEFEERYRNCEMRPEFIESGPREAARMAHQQFRLLFVYLHSPEHEDTDRFVTSSLCSNTVVQFLNRQMRSWGGNIHHADGFRLAGALSAATYPFCAVLAFSGSRLTLVTQIQGFVGADALLEALVQAVDMFEPRLVAERAEQQEREMARQLREEQDQAYQESLRLDREKAQKAEEKRRQEEEEIRKQQEEEQRKRLEMERQQKKREDFYNKIIQRRIQKQQQLTAEPDASTAATTLIRIRLPDGSNAQRRFYDQDKVSSVYDFVCGLGALQCWQFSLAMSYPRKVFGPDSYSNTLIDAGLSPQAVLFVQVEDEEQL